MKDFENTDMFKEMFMDAITDTDISMSDKELYEAFVEILETKFRHLPAGAVVDTLKLLVFQCIHGSTQEGLSADEDRFREENR
tara:strand:+ start:1956 stop:2204 length:249 start_codon:yes stop_codon:yes gene_type:complete